MNTTTPGRSVRRPSSRASDFRVFVRSSNSKGKTSPGSAGSFSWKNSSKIIPDAETVIIPGTGLSAAEKRSWRSPPGMGSTSTLVLINGRRMAPYGRADDGQKIFTDLSSIPIELVDRVEILLDGASAIYGADAIARARAPVTRIPMPPTHVMLEGGARQARVGRASRSRVKPPEGLNDEHGFSGLPVCAFG